MPIGPRVTPFLTAAGKLASVTVNGVTLNAMEFTPAQKGTPINVTNFNSPQFASAINGGTIQNEYLAPSTSEMTFNVRGPRDNSAAGYMPVVGDSLTCSFLYAPGWGFSFSAFVSDAGGGVNVNSSAQLEFQCVATGLITFLF